MDQKTLAKQMEIIHDAKRPNIDDLVQEIFTDFMELHGDRLYGDDHAMCCGIAKLERLFSSRLRPLTSAMMVTGTPFSRAIPPKIAPSSP